MAFNVVSNSRNWGCLVGNLCKVDPALMPREAFSCGADLLANERLLNREATHSLPVLRAY